MSIAVTGAAGSVSRRLLESLGSRPEVDSVIGLDRRSFVAPADKVLPVQSDLLVDDLTANIEGCRVLVHLAEDRGHGGDPTASIEMFERVLAAAAEVGVRHLILLSSAMVYGAHADNRIPLTESSEARPNPELAFGVTKFELETRLSAWTQETGADMTILRPTTTLSPRESSWVAGSLRSAAAVRPPAVDPPVQFLHHEDLNTAIVASIFEPIHGLVNVAPDGWVAPDEFRELAGASQLRVPDSVRSRVVKARKKLGKKPVPEGLDSYVIHPWVISNDKLRASGWEPKHTNSEAFVLGNPPPPWSLPPARRQEVALGVAGAAIAAGAALAGTIAKRATR